mmetsp:Transcript_148936/g.257982  ORF Transcript_148936/g.257982 Transcript_148936/m.257982 type:complete len:235 (-) Transcript_148936:1812-2516(-)
MLHSYLEGVPGICDQRAYETNLSSFEGGGNVVTRDDARQTPCVLFNVSCVVGLKQVTSFTLSVEHKAGWRNNLHIAVDSSFLLRLEEEVQMALRDLKLTYRCRKCGWNHICLLDSAEHCRILSKVFSSWCAANASIRKSHRWERHTPLMIALGAKDYLPSVRCVLALDRVCRIVHSDSKKQRAPRINDSILPQDVGALVRVDNPATCTRTLIRGATALRNRCAKDAQGLLRLPR